MLWNRLDSDRPFLNHYIDPRFDEGSGIEDIPLLERKLSALLDEYRDLPHPVAKAKLFAYTAEHIAVGYNPRSWFGVNFAGRKMAPSDRPVRSVTDRVWTKELLYDRHPEEMEELRVLQSCGLTFAYPDYSHCVSDWDAVMSLGFPGLLKRAEDAYADRKAKDDLSDSQDAFYQGTIMTLRACVLFIHRLLDSAKRHIGEDDRMPMVCECLQHLCEGKIKSVYDALQLNTVYYMLQSYLDGTECRTLGNLDQLLYPFYRADLESGRFTRDQIHEIIEYYLINFECLDHKNNHEFYLGGTDNEGNSRINELSYELLSAHDECGVISPKLFLKVASNTPDAWVKQALDMIRRGHSSIVFINEDAAFRSVLASGATQEEARNFLCTGCFEIQVLCEENMTADLYCNLAKCLELTLNRGYDRLAGRQIGIDVGDPAQFGSFEELFAAWQKETSFMMHRLAELNNMMESCLAQINPNPVYSSTIGSCVRRGVDAFDYQGVKYNTSEMMMPGTATVTDSLYVLDKYVFRERKLTLADFIRILNSNWADNEPLRQTILSDPEKYGNNLPRPDEMLKRVTSWAVSCATSIPTARGGHYKSSFESIDFCYKMGEHCAASPDGRRDGELLSRNLSATIGQDRKGITAFLQSASKIDIGAKAAAAPVDFVLHPSAVQGQEGLDAMLGLLRTFMKRGGLSLQGNVIDTDTLRKAQAHPEDYSTLQVRVTGWNWYFTNMTKKDQDWFIQQAETGN